MDLRRGTWRHQEVSQAVPSSLLLVSSLPHWPPHPGRSASHLPHRDPQPPPATKPGASFTGPGTETPTIP